MPDRYACVQCGRIKNCICKTPNDQRTRALLAIYTELRSAGVDLEELVAGGSDEESKRLDKAATVMKVGFKLLKQVLRRRGLTGRLKGAETSREPAPTGEVES